MTGRVRLSRVTPDGQRKEWPGEMTRREAAAAVRRCLLDNEVVFTNAAAVEVAHRVATAAVGCPVAGYGYTFELAAATRRGAVEARS